MMELKWVDIAVRELKIEIDLAIPIFLDHSNISRLSNLRGRIGGECWVIFVCMPWLAVSRSLDPWQLWRTHLYNVQRPSSSRQVQFLCIQALPVRCKTNFQ